MQIMSLTVLRQQHKCEMAVTVYKNWIPWTDKPFSGIMFAYMEYTYTKCPITDPFLEEGSCTEYTKVQMVTTSNETGAIYDVNANLR